jgi:hypothetical protein
MMFSGAIKDTRSRRCTDRKKIDRTRERRQQNDNKSRKKTRVREEKEEGKSEFEIDVVFKRCWKESDREMKVQQFKRGND